MKWLWLSVACLVGGSLPAQDDWQCLSAKQREQFQLNRVLTARAVQKLQQRDAVVDALQTPAEIQQYQQRMRREFVDRLGGFPEKTDLVPQLVGTIQADGYRIEKVIYQSRPNHRVTANLYLPDGEGPFPGIVVASGHSRTAKTADYNQRFGIMMAQHGMAALCYDPIGQGERSQILGDDGENRFSGTVPEHQLIGVGSTLVGRNTASYRVWDAIRSVDYLVARSEIDAQRIGMTGCSGGGTLTSYAMALDERIVCAAPACYLTSFASLLQTIGPQDAEQNIFGQIDLGMDHADYILMRAPRPTLISATSDDFMPIEGSWHAFRQAKRIYGRLGFPERVDLVEIDGDHGVKPQNLATIAHWMQRWLLDRDEPVQAVELDTRPMQQLWCTDSGQVLHRPDERSVFDFNAQHAEALKQQRQRLQANWSDDQLRQQITERIGADIEQTSLQVKSEVGPGPEPDDSTWVKQVIRVANGAVIPALVFWPHGDVRGACLWLRDEGKHAVAASDELQALLDDGIVVVAVDLRGQGELAYHRPDELIGDWKTTYLAYLLGGSLVGLQVEDVLAVAQAAEAWFGEEQSLQLRSAGDSAVVALHAAALRPNRFSPLDLQDVPNDWSSRVGDPVPAEILTHVVYGALEVYDLPDLRRLAARQ